ncbi:MAG TPA: glycoside hydrolase family 16 protein [Ideonella sp.]|uniref:glycoside hydrolase family 16 protein n=1 Tax=Ideonella sp. TaxID=1929293 RepID=UPI002CB01CAA|nr:glycoside hydrolase family 16 protein [Ideonella sp.]HSI47563.1 glycoside hydrolase family 16 protein [Ideonella sp.]
MKPLLLIAALLACRSTQATELFFDDFSQPTLEALTQNGWVVRNEPGHPGIAGAAWGPHTLRLVADPDTTGGRLLELEARTDGTPANSAQAQLCQQRKFLRGTYAARIRFHDTPERGPDGDPVIQTFYAVAPLRFDFDPEFSELDWEYLANGGWGSEKTRLYGIAWQTVRIEPWAAYNQAHEHFAALDGWHTLMMQVDATNTRLFLDGQPLATHGGRNHPVQPMAISFNLWFSPEGLLPASAGMRIWRQQVDWVLHAKDEQLSPAQVEAEVRRLRSEGVSHLDQVPAPEPALSSPCNI